MRIGIVGAGWAGLAAAVRAVAAGHQVQVFEAAPQAGGRARGVMAKLPDGQTIPLDNGQHILIGAYSECLALMRQVGLDLNSALLRLPLKLRYPDGRGLGLPDVAAPWDALAGVLLARGWSMAAKTSLVTLSLIHI